ncbi:MAG: hypothetical protein U9R32_00145 [Bacteroidota bacterium]|nr:hypothetical protein [Bacteroidota bacterium]
MSDKNHFNYSYQLNFKMADINSKYFSVLQFSNFQHSSSYGSNLKCAKTGKDEEFIGHFDVQFVSFGITLKSPKTSFK